MSITTKHIHKNFDGYPVLRDINLEIKNGELITLLGPSGSGKTTLLRIIAGLEFADQGDILIHDTMATHKSIRDRRVGFVFQHYSLFKHMTVFENIAFGLRVLPRQKRPQESDLEEEVFKLLQLVHLEGLAHRFPSQLSGGQRQRVALARTLAIKPSVLLLDEPFGSLDAKVRKELRRWLRRLQDELHMTSIFVTHDQEEAMEMADRVVVMNEGQIEQIGTPDEVYNSPANAFVYDFLGNYNEFRGWRTDEGNLKISTDIPLVFRHTNGLSKHVTQTDFSNVYTKIKHFFKKLLHKVSPVSPEVTLPALPQVSELPSSEQKFLKLFARPHEMELSLSPARENFIKGTIVHINPASPTVKIEIEHENQKTISQIDISKELFKELNLVLNQEIYISPKNPKIYE